MLLGSATDVGKINLAPLVPALEATQLDQLITRYIATCRTRLTNHITVDGYEYQLRWFTHWWQAEGPKQDWLLHPDDLMRFERYLRSAISPSTQRRLSYHSRATILKRLAEALRWAHEHGYVERDYTKWVPRTEGGPPKRRAATVAALIRLLEATEQGPQPLRDKTILAMLIGMGLRRAELSSINVEGVIVEADHSGYAHVVGKRTKANPSGERSAAFDKATGTIIVAYLDAIGRYAGPLFLSKRGERLTGQGIYKLVKKYIAAASLEGQIIGPHDLRRAFATHYRRNRKDKASADLLRRQLGHVSLSMTDQYTLLEVDDIREDMVSPLSMRA